MNIDIDWSLQLLRRHYRFDNETICIAAKITNIHFPKIPVQLTLQPISKKRRQLHSYHCCRIKSIAASCVPRRACLYLRNEITYKTDQKMVKKFLLLKGGDSGPGVTAVSVKNQELSVSFKSSKSGGSVSQRVQLFSTSKGGLCRSGFKTTPSKKRIISLVFIPKSQIHP